ncbi:LuxR C-terminal-related transcriptional regulator [Hanstruepera ponticola]|uniref:LuxR C-terminal-related transcriptional regulator n=1 Tax=Hanstruepera ponticola TaxID=2042995 RepID=UPI00177C18D5|nr:LuxR C-terminal-related transcriptional regulator [Hanstruepera ponticola]
MIYKLKTSNNSIKLFIALIFPAVMYCQTSERKVSDAIEQFMTTENPREGIQDLLKHQVVVEQVNDSLKGHFYLNLGIAYGQINHADSSFYFLDKSEKIANQIPSNFLLAMINNTRGLVYMGKAEYESSLSAYQEVMRLAEGKNDKRLNDVLSKTYGNLGGVYYQLGQMDKALETTKKCLTLSQTINDTTDIALNHLRLAMVYNDMNQLDNGIEHLNKARTFFKNLNNATMLVYAESNLGKVFKKKQNLDSAFVHYQEAHKYAKTLGEQEEYITTLLAMSSVKLEQDMLNKATDYAQKALFVAKKNGFSNSEQQAYDLLYQIALKKGKPNEALNFRNAYIKLADSLSSVEVKARVAALETQYETAKKEKEIQKLTFESQLNKAYLEKARNKQLIIAVSGFAVILIIIIFFVSKHKKEKAERIAQSLQVEALQKRFIELHSSPAELSVDLKMQELNQKLETPLTDREFEALKLCIAGKTNSEIAGELFVSVSTIKFHLRNAYSKLGVNNRKEAFKYMLKSI